VLKDTGRALTIFPVGREPGEVRVLIIEATGLGALSPDDGGRSERMIGEDDDNESAERSMTTPLSTSSSLKEFDKKTVKSDGIKSDPHVAKSGLLLNKNLLSKIKDIKSNLGLKPKVLFNNSWEDLPQS
jgi:hypothetical protein